ncbi:DUF6223 family protein [Micromonospora chaiyaphumensis]|uniref:Uncharacterized protein n=1 Tax=Micromonospora chaiyaphumensis TaxID=307119 RepID=A0A1C4US79_9ACTN|nr:DUF6223 family protein [Micromonospora chaiyaphumensis]SCE74566.1 hypothetical protein GA0070214_101965 [Micromonospora chaiyaphumensis]
MSTRHLFAAAAALLGEGGPATPAAARASAAVDPYTLTTGRLVGTAAALVALAGVVVGVLALARSAGRVGNGAGRRGALVALVAGLAGMVTGGLVVAAAEGGPGTGYGIVGGFAALAIGLIAAVLGWLALARSRRTV